MKRFLLSIFLVTSISSFAADTVWTPAPVIITQPGTYSNLFIKSTSSSVPCVQINPQGSGVYVLDHLALYSTGDAITVNGNSHTTIKYCKIQNLPSDNPKGSGKAIFIYNPYSVDIEHNELSSTGGINVQGWKGGINDSCIIRYNRSRNIDGRTSLNREGGARHFIWFNTCWNIAKSDIGWNENIDIPDSSVEQDVVNFYNTSGVAGSPINMHDNYFQGVYPYPSSLQKTSGDGMITDGDNQSGKTKLTTTSFIQAYNNQFVGMGNAGMNIANGHDIRYFANRIIGSGYFPNGTKYTGEWSGVCIWNSAHIPDSLFYNNSIDSNYIGYTSWGANYTDPRSGIYYKDRQDENNTSTNIMKRWVNYFAPPVPITLQDEAKEYAMWKAKLASNGVVLELDSANIQPLPIPPVLGDTGTKQPTPTIKDSFVYIHDTTRIYIDTAKPKLIHDTVFYPVHDTLYGVPKTIYQYTPVKPLSRKLTKEREKILFKNEEIV